MKFATIASVLAMATVAIATPAPADIEARTGPGGGKPSVCSSKTKQVCCNGLLNCVVQVLGGSCGGNSYCCKTSAPAGALVNVALLNCVKLL
ncbi:Ff.00g077990.m01.CDS01 [Fusarium sp. VM40]|nr:Ff.00g077990.m01.CDS01 [Fusarium sp. VM40]